MNIETIILTVILGVVAVAGLLGIIIAIVRGDMKKFVEEKMVEAENLKLTGEKKLAYGLQAVKEKYKVVEVLLNCKKFIEHIIDLTKKINIK